MASPTIHASLEKGLDTVSASSTDYDDDEEFCYDSASVNDNDENSSTSSDDEEFQEFEEFDGQNENLRTPSKFSTKTSYSLAVEKSPLKPKSPPNLPPRSAGKENWPPMPPPLPPKNSASNRPAPVQILPPPSILVTKGKSPKSVYHTPVRNQNSESKSNFK